MVRLNHPSIFQPQVPICKNFLQASNSFPIPQTLKLQTNPTQARLGETEVTQRIKKSQMWPTEN